MADKMNEFKLPQSHEWVDDEWVGDEWVDDKWVVISVVMSKEQQHW